MVDNPIEWYEQKYCKKCKNKPCQKKGGGVYGTDWSAKLFCVLTLTAMLEYDRAAVKNLHKSQG